MTIGESCAVTTYQACIIVFVTYLFCLNYKALPAASSRFDYTRLISLAELGEHHVSSSPRAAEMLPATVSMR
jgi:hypothetical protein